MSDHAGDARTPPEEGPADAPTAGSPTGVHRVVSPAGAFPYHADQLDAHPDVWDSETRIGLEALVLEGAAYEGWRDRLPQDPGTRRAAILEMVAERGALGGDLRDTVLVGRLEARGPASPTDLRPGQRVVALAPAAALPTWLRDVSGWGGGSLVVPARGHAICAASSPLLRVPNELHVGVVAEVARAAAVPQLVSRLATGITVVLGPTTTQGAVAVLAARDVGADVVAVVSTLPDARLARAIGASRVVIADPREPTGVARAVLDACGRPGDAAVVATATPGALASAVAATREGGAIGVTAVGDELVPALELQAALGAAQSVTVAGRAAADDGRAALRLVTSSAAVRDLAAWRAGVAPSPAAARPEES